MKTVFEGIEVEYPVGMKETEAIYFTAEQKELNPKMKLLKVKISIGENDTVDIEPHYDTISRVRRITGYLSTIPKFNDAKRAEAADRVVHFSQDLIDKAWRHRD